MSTPSPSRKTLRQRLAGREDTEHVQALIRIVLGLTAIAYLYFAVGPRFDLHMLLAVFTAISCAIFVAIVARPERSPWRQRFANVVDVATTTWAMWRFGEPAAPLYGIYLWITFGNGFRFGTRALYVSQALSLIGFAAVVAATPYWRENPFAAGGLLVLLAAVPLYGAVLLRALAHAHESLHHQAMRDALTGLYNRRYWMEAFERELHRAQRHRECVGVMIMDIDHFKRLNDTFGHAAGDEVLRAIARVMQKLVRAEDVLCRFGGEEFVLVQTRASADAIIQRAEQFRRAVAAHEIFYGERPLGFVTLSVGVALFPEHGATAQALLHAADAALYRAKDGGRNRSVMFTGIE